MIRAHGLSKSFRVHQKEPGLMGSISSLFHRRFVDKHAVDNVGFSVGAGEIVGLVGANGAGKTTLVKMLAGIIHPSSGEAEVLGYRPLDRDDRMRQRIALIMGQKAQLWWDLPAADGFLLLKEIYRIPEAEYQERLDELSTMLELDALLGTPIRRLSLGERMKLELVAALLHQPEVVFLDEPTIGLDLTAQIAVRRFLREYQQRHNPAMIITSHYMADIESLCQRLLILRQGRLIYDGPTKEVQRLVEGRRRLHAQLPIEAVEQALVDPEIAEFGLVERGEEGELVVDLEASRLPALTARLLDGYPVHDLAIRGEDLATIVEQLIRCGSRGDGVSED